MSKGKIIIIEDEFFAAEHLKDLIQSFGFSVSNIYHSGEDFLRETDWSFDAAIVDIFLSKKLTGLDVAKEMNKKQKPYIFLTANQDAETLKKAAELFPSSYLSKPFNQNDVEVALEIIINKMNPKIRIRLKNSVLELDTNKIYLIKSDGAYIEIYTEYEKIIQRKLLKKIESELPHCFIRVHRSYLVNKNYIKEKTASHITVGKHQVPYSRNFRNNLPF